MTELKPCPFCGGVPIMYGRERRDYVDGTWAKATGKEYWVKPRCSIMCMLGNMHSRVYGVIGGIEYTSPEAAAAAWNRRYTDSDCPLVEAQDKCDSDSCPIQYNADEFFSAERSDGM